MNTTWPTLGYRFTANVDVVAHLTHTCAGKLGVVVTTKRLSFAVSGLVAVRGVGRYESAHVCGNKMTYVGRQAGKLPRPYLHSNW